MRQSYRIIPIYTADVSGVCSALYELGGMTVMHDPSGCNSTYNTHDEIRWYDQDSLIFISMEPIFRHWHRYWKKKPGFLHLQYRRTECMIMCMGQELH